MSMLRWIVALAAILLIAGCGSDKGHDMEFVLPKGYKGGFVVVTNSPDGTQARIAKGKWRLVVPKNGVLKIRDDPFQDWSTWRASYSDGTRIPDSIDFPNPYRVRFYDSRFGGSHGRQRFNFYYIGTKAAWLTEMQRTGLDDDKSLALILEENRVPPKSMDLIPLPRLRSDSFKVITK